MPGLGLVQTGTPCNNFLCYKIGHHTSITAASSQNSMHTGSSKSKAHRMNCSRTSRILNSFVSSQITASAQCIVTSSMHCRARMCLPTSILICLSSRSGRAPSAYRTKVCLEHLNHVQQGRNLVLYRIHVHRVDEMQGLPEQLEITGARLDDGGRSDAPSDSPGGFCCSLCSLVSDVGQGLALRAHTTVRSPADSCQACAKDLNTPAQCVEAYSSSSCSSYQPQRNQAP